MERLVQIEEILYRRSYPDKKYMNPNDGSPTSRVFKPRPKDEGKLSVDVKSMTTFEKAVVDKERFCLFEISNESVAKVNLKTVHDPLPDGANDAHALICSIKEDDDITPALLARASKRIFL